MALPLSEAGELIRTAADGTFPARQRLAAGPLRTTLLFPWAATCDEARERSRIFLSQALFATPTYNFLTALTALAQAAAAGEGKGQAACAAGGPLADGPGPEAARLLRKGLQHFIASTAGPRLPPILPPPGLADPRSDGPLPPPALPVPAARSARGGRCLSSGWRPSSRAGRA